MNKMQPDEKFENKKYKNNELYETEIVEAYDLMKRNAKQKKQLIKNAIDSEGQFKKIEISYLYEQNANMITLENQLVIKKTKLAGM